MYVLTKSKSDSLLTNVKYSLIVKTLLFSSMRSHERMTLRPDDATEEKLDGVCLRARDPRIRREKSSFGRWGKLALLLIGQSSYRWLEKDANRPLGEVASGKRRSWKDRFLLSSSSWDKDYLSIWSTLYNWNLRFITGPRPAKYILWRCVDIWQSSYLKDKVCVWRATGQKSLKCLLSWTVPSISFKESYRVTSCLC